MSINAGEKILWHTDIEGSFTIQTATGPPVIAEGYQDSDRTTGLDREVRMESYPIRFLTARQERTEVVTRAGLVFSI